MKILKKRIKKIVKVFAFLIFIFMVSPVTFMTYQILNPGSIGLMYQIMNPDKDNVRLASLIGGESISEERMQRIYQFDRLVMEPSLNAEFNVIIHSALLAVGGVWGVVVKKILMWQ